MHAANESKMAWRDPKNGGITPLRCRGDLPLPVRLRQQNFSKIYQPLKDLLVRSPLWGGKTKLAVNGFKGQMMMLDETEAWPLVSCSHSGMGVEQFLPHYGELKEW
eukprot:1511785-Pyramimonas_sp.AAC.1